MTKKHAWIRTEENRKCPFGLPITEACINAGSSIHNMCPLKEVEEDKRDAIEKANKRVYIYYRTNSRCLYASNIIKKYDAVNCDFGDTGAGIGSPAFSGSPLYVQNFAGAGLHGLYAYPLGFYGDNASSRNLFMGLFSLIGDRIFKIIKTAKEDIIEKLLNKKSFTKRDIEEICKAHK